MVAPGFKVPLDLPRTAKLFFIFILLGFLSWSQAEEAPLANQTFMRGQNVTSTSDVLRAGQCAVGPTAAACGISNYYSIGTSPWLYYDYNMYSLALRGLLSQDKEQNRWAFELNYLRTFRKFEGNSYYVRPNYQMESLWTKLIRTYYFNSHYRLHLNVQANYYWDEKMPFSLRRPYVKKTPWQFNLSMLHEMDLVHGWFILGELGLLDLLRDPLHLHAGASIGRVWKSFSFHLGFTMTGSYDAIFSPLGRADYHQELRSFSANGYDGDLDPYRVKQDFSIHPEFSVQYIF